MINALLLSASAIGISAQGIIKKYYNGKVGGRGVFLFTSVSVLFSCLIFVITSGGNLDFRAEVIPYSLGFAVSYGAAALVGFLAIKYGPLSITSLITSYSLVIPTFFGLIFLGEEVGFTFWIGFALLIVSLFLINSRGGEIRITPLWVVFVILAFLGNGICSAVQAAEQRAFSGGYKSEFMITALLCVSATILLLSLFTERGDAAFCLKRGTHLMAMCGCANGLVNLFIMLLVSSMSAALMYPIISAGGIVLSWGVSRFLYKEKLTLGQNIALVLGICSVIFMNI